MNSPASRKSARKQGPVGLEKVETDETVSCQGIRYVADGYDLDSSATIWRRDRDNFLMHLDEGGKILPRHRRLRAGIRHDRHLDRHGADVRHMTDPSKLGPIWRRACWRRCTARWLQTFSGLPIADKLHGKLLDEETNRTLIIDGI